MKDVLEEFTWSVAPKYEWQDWLDASGKPVTVPQDGLASLESAAGIELLWNRNQRQKREYGPVLRPLLADSSELCHYKPLSKKHAALFKDFAAVDCRSPAAVLTFATKYGALGVPPQSQSIRYRKRDGTLNDHHAHGEPFLRWALEICFMREGIRLASGRRSFADLKRLKWLFDRNLQHFQGRLAFTPDGALKLAVEPLTLIAAMWLQLALAVTGDKKFVGCKFCGRVFEISTEPTGSRRHREFCSDSCKTLDYRKRKRTALSLAESGQSARDIASKTRTKGATVRAWLADAKRKKHMESGDA